jgi:polysaccharide export outer membrane protein
MGTFRIAGFLAFCMMAISAAAVAQPASGGAQVSPTYIISPGDELRVFVWKNPDLTVSVPVRPDGKISTPLVPDMQAQGKTPSGLAADLTAALGNYIQNPVVTVLVTTVGVANASSVRVIGAAATPKALPYRAGMTVLDAVIEVGGLNTFASGNSAVLIRTEGSSSRNYPLRLNDLVKNGDMSANMRLMPGDVIRIPERWF